MKSKLMCCLTIALTFGCGESPAPARSQSPTASLQDAIKILSKTKDGDSLANLEAQLGHGDPDADVTSFRQIVLSMPSRYKQGIQDGDQFIVYRWSEADIALQFRNGRLINHIPSEYNLQNNQSNVLSKAK